MKVAGIVAEFNPLHTGHERIIKFCHENLGADAVVVCMSGNFVQRGEPAILDKYTRAITALGTGVPALASSGSTASGHSQARAGADLVIELPVLGATANAEVFAKTGVSTLLATGVVTDLVFGSESGDEDAIERAARLLLDEPPEFKTVLNEDLKTGLSYPAAMAKAAAACGADASIFSNPNDLLGILYVKTLMESGQKISFHSVKRIGADHNSTDIISENISSATAIRKHLAEGQNIENLKEFLPSASFNALSEGTGKNALVFPDDISMLLHEKLYSVPDLTIFSDIDTDLTNRILKKREDFTDFTEFAELLDTRNYTRSRLRRALLHLVLGITDEACASLRKCNYAPYIHVLAMNDIGAGLLGKILFPVFCSLSENAVNELSEDAAACLQKDIFANDLYNIILTSKNGKPRRREASRKVLKI